MRSYRPCRNATGRSDDSRRLNRLPELAAELVHLKVDVIIAVGTLAPLAAKRATTTISIVMGAAGDPIGSGRIGVAPVTLTRY
jgi:ABC-type uncharacterized transport system substrate-binding protein